MNALLLLLALSGSPAADQALAAAASCSNMALHTFAIANDDTARAVASAAFDKCAGEWHRYQDAMDRDLERDLQRIVQEAETTHGRAKRRPPPNPVQMKVAAFQQLKAAYVARAATIVLDVRTVAALKK